MYKLLIYVICSIFINHVYSSTLCVVCRDFVEPSYANIPDNEQNSVQLDSMLDTNGKPFLSSVSLVNANVTQLFNSINGVNIQLSTFAINYNLAYHNPTLYQFDGQGYGNQADLHNYYFTCEIYGEGYAHVGDTLYLGSIDESWAFVDGINVIENGKFGVSLSDGIYTFTEEGPVQIKMFMLQRNNLKSELHFETSSISIIDIATCDNYISEFIPITPYVAPTPTVSPTPSPTGTPASSPTPSPTDTPASSPTPSPTGTPTVIPTPSPTGTPITLPDDIVQRNDTLISTTSIQKKIAFGLLLALVPIIIFALLVILYMMKKRRIQRLKEAMENTPNGDNKIKLHGYLIE